MPGNSDSFPVVGDDAIYAIAQKANPYQQSPPPTFALYVYALSREDGTEIWRQTLASQKEGTNGLKGPHTLCLGSDGLYAVWSKKRRTRQVIARLSPSDGSKQWQQTFQHRPRRQQPVVRDGRLYIYGRETLIALDTGDGSELWRTPSRMIGHSLPTVGKDCVVVYHQTPDRENAHSVTAFEREDQSVRWRAGFSTLSRPTLPSTDRTVFVSEFTRLDGETNPKRVLENPTARDRRKIHALSLSDGTERWTHTYDTDEMHQSPTVGGATDVTVTDEHVYYGLGFLPVSLLPVAQQYPETAEEKRKELTEQMYRGPNVVALDRTDGSVVWRTTVGSQPHVFQPLVAGPENLYVIHAGLTQLGKKNPKVYVIDRNSGEVRGSFDTPNLSCLSVSDGTLYAYGKNSVRAWE